jgi:murein DD-endopeptidase MepM/ murein hydrolase activator NlpD
MSWVFGRSSPSKGRFLTLVIEQGGRQRQWRLDTGAALVIGVLLVLMGLWAVATTLYLVFRDDLIVNLVSRQAQVQYAYEDKIAGLQASIDKVTSRQVLDQDTIEGKLQDLVSRQAQIETRQALVAQLASQAEAVLKPNASPSPAVAAAPVPPSRPQAAPPPPQAATVVPRDAVSVGASAFAPVDKPHPLVDFGPLRGIPAPARPSAEAVPARPSAEAVPAPSIQQRQSLRLDPSLPAEMRLAAMREAMSSAEAAQVTQVRRFESHARRTADRLAGVIANLGLDRSRFASLPLSPAQGGPLVPIAVDPKVGPFEAGIDALQRSLADAERLRRIVRTLPLRRPLAGDPDTTSSFGYRVDPFTRGMAMHTGVDFREEWGSPVRVTAAGKVVTAEWTGGYGNMVEVDHGNGISTRYGHLSQILVEEGRQIEAGAVIGKLGSTGRSTGPHLHYETRVDGDPVDPMRYLRGASALALIQ